MKSTVTHSKLTSQFNTQGYFVGGFFFLSLLEIFIGSLIENKYLLFCLYENTSYLAKIYCMHNNHANSVFRTTWLPLPKKQTLLSNLDMHSVLNLPFQPMYGKAALKRSLFKG